MNKLNFSNELQTDWNQTNWIWARDIISSKLHDSDSKFLAAFEIDDIFFFGKKILKYNVQKQFSQCDAWIGVTHQHRKYLKEQDFKSMDRYMDKCACLFTLSPYMKEFWQDKYPDNKIFNLYHPCPEPKTKFDLYHFRKDPHIRSLGRWGRLYDIWDNLDLVWRRRLTSKEIMLPKNSFDKIFSNTIQFMHLEDASANNGVIECIMRNCPLLINKIDPVVQYLGNSYPFYSSNLEEAQEKVNDSKLIEVTHSYLKKMSKTFLSSNYFYNHFVKGILS